MQCKSLWIKASAKCINVNVNVDWKRLTESHVKLSGTVWSFLRRLVRMDCSYRSISENEFIIIQYILRKYMNSKPVNDTLKPMLKIHKPGVCIVKQVSSAHQGCIY